METIYYRRKLPHIHPHNVPLFITFNLVDSLSAALVAQLKAEREKELQAAQTAEDRYRIQKKYFGHYDAWLDRCQHGHDWLRQESIAQIVADEIHRVSGQHYELYAYCIMPNHVHLLIRSLIEKFPPSREPTAVSPVAEIMRLLRGRTARYCNLALHREGKFWQHESYDHYVRNEPEMERIILYILNNPVKAGLAKEWRDWKFSYVNPDLGEW